MKELRKRKSSAPDAKARTIAKTETASSRVVSVPDDNEHDCGAVQGCVATIAVPWHRSKRAKVLPLAEFYVETEVRPRVVRKCPFACSSLEVDRWPKDSEVQKRTRDLGLGSSV